MNDPWTPDTSRVALGDRTLFPTLEPFAYLAHAGISPASTELARAVQAVVTDYAARGVGTFPIWRDQRERLRGRIARLLQCAPREVAFVPNTTRSVIDLSLCIPWRRGDRVLCLRGEFPTNVTPWQRAAETFGLEIAWLDAESFRTDAGLEAFEAELVRGLRLVAVSAVQFQTGLRMPIEAMAARAHAAGAEIFVDAIQACGIVPIDVRASDIDYLGCGSHKWLMGLEGAGFLFVREDRARMLVPRVAGWLSHEEPLRFLFEGLGHLRYDRPIRKEASMLESGAANGIGLAALEASLAAIESIGVEAISAHVGHYLDALEKGCRDRGFVSERSHDPTRRSGILALRAPAGVDLARLHAGLESAGVTCSTPDGRLRFAPHWPNSEREVPEVLRALDEAVERAS